jgi:hypothetical protein
VKRIASIVSVCFLASGLMTGLSGLVSAQEGGRIYTSEAQGKTDKPVTITVSPYGMVISFIEVQESVEKFWTTDYSHLRIGADTPSGKGAKLLFLKTEGELNADTKGTSLTVITKTAIGEPKVYSFLVDFTNTKPTYSIVRIYPDRNLKGNSVARLGTPRKTASISLSPSVRPSQAIRSTAVAPATSIKGESPSLQQSGSGKTDLFYNPSIKAAQSRPETVLAQTTDTSTIKIAKATDSASADVVPTKVTNAASADVAATKATDSASADVVPTKATDSASADVAATKATDSVSTDTGSSVQKTEAPKSDQQKVVEKDNALPIEPIRISNSSLPPATSLRSTSLTQANALVRGLTIANKTKEIGYTSPISRSVQNIVRRLRRGEKLQNAAPKETVQWKTILHLLKLGKYQGDV